MFSFDTVGADTSELQKRVGTTSSSSGPPQNPNHTTSWARMGKGMNVLPPSKSDLNGYLNFTKKSENDRYKALCLKKKIIPCKFIHQPTLEALNIKTELFELIQNIG